MRWRTVAFILLGIAAIFGGGVLIVRLHDPSLEDEQRHLIRTAFSHPEIVKWVGSVKDASISLVPADERPRFGRTIPQDLKRKKANERIEGRARVFILGSREGGIFTIAYTFDPITGDFVVVKIEAPFRERPS